MSGSAKGRFFVETWGCQMNQLDSQRMTGQLLRQGLLPTREAGEADVILLNSCSVREKAAQKAYSRLGEYRLLKRDNPDLVLGFCGCVAEQEGEEALRRIPDLDFVVGTGRIGELAGVVARSRRGERPVVTGFPEVPDYQFDEISRSGEYKGMVTVVEGCDKRCTFCVVPATRGPERCRPLAEILAEVRHLLNYGFVEIELLGQTVNHWRGSAADGRELDFADLLDAVATLDGLKRLRFVTSYPRDFTPRMVAAFAAHEAICPYLHLPVQSGSDRILQRMGRGYDVAAYERLVADLRRHRPDLALSTDIIVGFPGETDEDFAATLQLVERIRFAGIFAFRYSPRPGTAALRLADDEIPGRLADDRLQRLLAVQSGIQHELNHELVGREMEVLVTGIGKAPGELVARTDCHRVVHLHHADGVPAPVPSLLGRLMPARITTALPHSLLAEPTSGPARGGGFRPIRPLQVLEAGGRPAGGRPAGEA